MNSDQDDSSMLLVSVAAESLQTGKAGVLIIQKHHDTSFSVVFCSIGEIEMADIDCVSVDVKERRVSFNDFAFSIPSSENSSLPSQQTISLSFSIPDRVHLQHFVDAQAECQRVCNMFLELRSRFVDIYCGAVYSELGVQMQPSSCLNGPITEELSKLQLQSLRKLDADIVHGSLSAKIEENASNNNQHNINSPATSSHHMNSSTNACCFYCEATPKDGELFNHPYVPLSFDKSRVLMCNVCLNNWKDYRDAAHRDLQLILPGEINEEICALCSDTPDTLVLCNVCPRSFCNTCLRHVLGDNATDRILHSHNDALWKCMSCANRVSAQPLLSRDVWVSWKKIQCENNQNHNNPTSNPKNNSSNQHSISRVKDTEVDVPTIALSVASGQKMKRSSTAANSKMKKSKPSPSKALSIPSQKTLSVDTSTVQQTESTTDEVFYFAQYLDFLERKCTNVVEKFKKQQMQVINKTNNQNSGKNSASVNSYTRGKRKQQEISRNHNDSENDEEEDETDDACFLCKDGGEVIECDFSRRVHCLSVRRGVQGSGSTEDVVQRAPQQCRCRKVYHSYCLNYEVSDEVQKWYCPRHFCSHCGRTDTLHYLCAFCPLSLCKTCAPLYARGCANQGGSTEGAAQTQRALNENDNVECKKFYFTLPNLTPKSQEINLADEEEVHKGVASQWMAPYRFPNVTLIACDTCATHCLKLQRESSGDAAKYFYTLLGEKCFFDMSRDTQVEVVNEALQDTHNSVAGDTNLAGNTVSSNPSISIQDVNCSDTLKDGLLNNSNNNTIVAVEACENIRSSDNGSTEIKKLAETHVSSPQPPLQVMCVSDDEGSV